MQKYIKVTVAFLTLFLVLTGCADKKETSTINERKVDERTLEPADYWYPDNEKLKLVEEDKSLLKEKEEFLKLFKKLAGFSLPEYFFIPKITDETDWNDVDINERYMDVYIYTIIKKSDALEMLEHLRNDDRWIARYGKYELISRTQEQRGISIYFEISEKWNPTVGNNSAHLRFIYYNDFDVYILNIMACLERDPPPGTSWPKEQFH